jgi:hypothetical protein
MKKIITLAALLACFATALPREARPAGAKDPGSEELVWRSERACGVNCVYLMLGYFDKDVRYEKLERDLWIEQGRLNSLTDLKRELVASGLSVMIARADREALKTGPLPVIAHMEVVTGRGDKKGHFVLVTIADDNDVSYVDGTTAVPQTVPWREFERDWTGYVLIHDRPGAGWLLRSAVFVAVGAAFSALYDLRRRRARSPLR